MNRVTGISVVGIAVVASLYSGLHTGSSLKPTNPAAHFSATTAHRAVAHHAAVVWGSSVPAALAKARQTGKPVVIDLFATWCGPCKMLDEAYSRAPLSTELTNWVPVKVDTDKDPTTARKYKVEGLPTLVFLRPDGTELGRSTGYAVGNDIHSKDQMLASVAQEIGAALQANRAKLTVHHAAKRHSRSHRA